MVEAYIPGKGQGDTYFSGDSGGKHSEYLPSDAETLKLAIEETDHAIQHLGE